MDHHEEKKLAELLELKESQDNLIALRAEVPRIYSKYAENELAMFTEKINTAQFKIEKYSVDYKLPVPDLSADLELKICVDVIQNKINALSKCMEFAKF